ncbi:MAG: hypothetical protein PHV53_01695 [Fermentimonas sp.]|nr:hypothetical protein [Fermentimonas sp.]
MDFNLSTGLKQVWNLPGTTTSEEYHVFPIPQVDISKSKVLEQNQGY